MIKKIRQLVPHPVVNYIKHWPEALVANWKYGFPGRKITIIGVTGTDGKTTTVNLIYSILKNAGKKTSMISTINAVIGGKIYNTGFHVTNPHSNTIQQFLRQAVDHGDEFMILEVTSHGLDQFRVWGVPFNIGVITNITHEHLDYHKTFEKYLSAKAKLIKNVQIAVLNKDDPSFDKLSKMTSGKIISFGLNKTADFNPDNFPLHLKIPGEYNLFNALTALAVTTSLGIDSKIIKNTLENFTGLVGRMEEIKNNLGLKIVVDFAHTPNALEQALMTLRENTKGKLIAVFGCASERDQQKRPLMGRISSQLADITILTDEDPRFEDRQQIIEEIYHGMDQKKVREGQNLFKESDRKKAIKLAISLAKKGDTIGIFGKGHEQSMNYLGKEKFWSDTQAISEVLQNGR